MWQRSTQESGQYSNFGPLWWLATERLSELSGRHAYPVASGTEAVTLAALATQAELDIGDYGTAVEAFTFEAGRIACERTDGVHGIADLGVREVRSKGDCKRDSQGVIIRVMPFGSHRSFVGREYDDQHIVVDAAGGFGPGAFNANVRPNQAIAVSFHATKNFPIGEGGAVLLPTAWKKGAEAVVRAMNFGFDQHARVRKGRYATNAKIDELRCAMLIAQLGRADYFKQRSTRIRRHTLRLIDQVEQLRAPYQLGAWQSLVVVQCDQIEKAMVLLKEANIACREVFPGGRIDLLDKDERNLLALPSDCTDDELDQVASVLREVYR